MRVTFHRPLGMLLGLALASGCGTTVPFQKPQGSLPADRTPGEVRDQFAARLADRYAEVNSLVLRFGRRKMAALGCVAVDRRQDTFTVVCMTPMGFKLLELTGGRDGIACGFILPELNRRGHVAEAMGEDIRNAYFGLVPDPVAVSRKEKDALVFSHDRGSNRVEHVFSGTDGFLTEKRIYKGRRLVCRIRYYEYREKNGHWFPHGIVLDNRAYRYRLIVKTREIMEDRR